MLFCLASGCPGPRVSRALSCVFQNFAPQMSYGYDEKSAGVSVPGPMVSHQGEQKGHGRIGRGSREAGQVLAQVAGIKGLGRAVGASESREPCGGLHRNQWEPARLCPRCIFLQTHVMSLFLFPSIGSFRSSRSSWPPWLTCKYLASSYTTVGSGLLRAALGCRARTTLRVLLLRWGS